MKRNFADPPIMKDDILVAIRKTKLGKAAGPGQDSISMKLSEALKEYGIDYITILLNETNDTGQIPPDIFKSLFIALPNKPGATACELHTTVYLMSHITKILLKIIMM